MDSNAEKETTRARALAPFGTWKWDRQLNDLKPHCTPLPGHLTASLGDSSLTVYATGGDTYLVKTVDLDATSDDSEPLSVRLASLRRGLHMMLLAGEECVPQPIGRVFHQADIVGYIQPLYDATLKSIKAKHDSKKRRRGLSPTEEIHALSNLVHRLHRKGIIHGDIRRDNLRLVDIGGITNLTFWDFSAANLDDACPHHTGHTVQYLSPFRASPSTLSLSAQYTSIIFDLGDVLFGWSPETKTSISPKILRQILSSATWHDYERGRLSEQECYDKVGAAFQLAPDEIREAFIQARASLVASHDIIKLVRELKEESYGTLRVYAMSNISLPDWEVLRTKPADWSIFDDVFTSGAAGERKPDAAFYNHVIASTGVDPSATIFVDDKAENVNAANAVGLRGLVFDTDENVSNVLISSFRPEAKHPLSTADDLYACGITMWEIYTGTSAFETDSDELDVMVVEDVVASGFQPNISAIDDAKIRTMIFEYLKEGNLPLPDGATHQGQIHCVTADVPYAGCRATPPHTHEKTVHSRCCAGRQCENPYRSPILLSHIDKMECPECPF